MGVPIIRTIMDHNILGSMLGSPFFRKLSAIDLIGRFMGCKGALRSSSIKQMVSRDGSIVFLHEPESKLLNGGYIGSFIYYYRAY